MSLPPVTQHALDSLETLIDRHGMTRVLQALAEICELKADHLRANWQDETLAKQWSTVADALSEFTTSEDLPS